MKVNSVLSFFIGAMIASSAASAETYYWGSSDTGINTGGFNTATWYDNQEGTGEPITVDFSSGEHIIDRVNGAYNSQSPIGLTGEFKLAEWNDTGSGSGMWHMYAQSSGISINVGSMTKTSAGTLRIRAAGSSTSFNFTVQDAIDISAGRLQIGTQSESSGTTGFALFSMTAGSINSSGTASSTFAISRSFDTSTINMNGGKIYICNGTESESDPNSLQVDISTLNFGDREGSATQNQFWSQAYYTSIRELNIGGSSASGIYNRNSSDGFFIIEEINICEGFTGSFTFGNSTGSAADSTKKFIIGTLNTDANKIAHPGIVYAYSYIEIEEANHVGAGGAAPSVNNYNFLMQGGSGNVTIKNLNVSNGATVGYGIMLSMPQNNYLGSVRIRNVNVTDGSLLWFNTTSLTQDASGTITVSGPNSSIIAMVGNSPMQPVADPETWQANLQGSIVIENGGLFRIRRMSNSPSYFINDVQIVSGEYGSSFMAVQDANYPSGTLKINSISFLNGLDSPTETGPASLFDFAVNNAATVNIGTMTVGDYASVEIGAYNPATVGSISTGEFSSFYLKNSRSSQENTMTVTGDFQNAGKKLALGSKANLLVQGDFVNTCYYAGTATPLGLDLYNYGSMVVEGAFVNNGLANLGAGMTSGQNANYSFGGISSSLDPDKTQTYRIYASSTSGNVNITLTGDDTYIYTNRIHNFGAAVTDLSGVTSRINFVKNGMGTQYFASNHIYFLGTTTVNAGALYICANGTQNTLKRGIGDVILNAGIFGACGVAISDTQVEAIGVVKADNFTWDNSGNVAVDFAGVNCDFIDLSGNFTKSKDSTDGTWGFIFNGTMSYNTEYALITWDGTTDFSETDFDITSSTGNILDGVFSIKDNTLYYTTAIPEPAEYAAIFGFAALILAYMRRRNRR